MWLCKDASDQQVILKGHLKSACSDSTRAEVRLTYPRHAGCRARCPFYRPPSTLALVPSGWLRCQSLEFGRAHGDARGSALREAPCCWPRRIARCAARAGRLLRLADCGCTAQTQVEREQRLLASLSHPNVIGVRDTFQDDFALYQVQARSTKCQCSPSARCCANYRSRALARFAGLAQPVRSFCVAGVRRTRRSLGNCWRFS